MESKGKFRVVTSGEVVSEVTVFDKEGRLKFMNATGKKCILEKADKSLYFGEDMNDSKGIFRVSIVGGEVVFETKVTKEESLPRFLSAVGKECTVEMVCDNV